MVKKQLKNIEKISEQTKKCSKKMIKKIQEKKCVHPSSTALSHRLHRHYAPSLTDNFSEDY